MAIRSAWPPLKIGMSPGRRVLKGLLPTHTPKLRSPLSLNKMNVQTCSSPTLEGSFRDWCMRKQIGITISVTSHRVRTWVRNSGFSSNVFQSRTSTSWKHCKLFLDPGRMALWLECTFCKSLEKPLCRNVNSLPVLMRARSVRNMLKPPTDATSYPTTGSPRVSISISGLDKIKQNE